MGAATSLVSEPTVDYLPRQRLPSPSAATEAGLDLFSLVQMGFAVGMEWPSAVAGGDGTNDAYDETVCRAVTTSRKGPYISRN